ncbi:MAG TPA: SDR family oxidoreductase [Acidimicrobiales bacterium]|nr:SDR family oxidoreductase [Acidimicrobiales bacterium]
MSNELTGKVAIVTGGSSGIGLRTAERFLAEGARVVIADIDREHGEEVVARLGADAAFQHTDVADPDQVTELVADTVARFAGLHVMFNNAGISGVRHPTLFDDDFADFHRVMDVNLLGVMVGTREAARHMATAGGGSIINISSIGGINAAPSLWSYHLSKSSVIFFTKAAAVGLGQHGVRVNCICPGNIETPILEQTMASHLPEEERGEHMRRIREYILSQQPLQRQGTTDDIAEAALYLASDRSSYVTGTTLPVDGGMVAGNPSRTGGINRLQAGGTPG